MRFVSEDVWEASSWGEGGGEGGREEGSEGEREGEREEEEGSESVGRKERLTDSECIGGIASGLTLEQVEEEGVF